MPKVVDHQAYRSELLAKSFELFAAHGYAALTMRELAKSLGVSTGTLYHYFPTKEELFHQLVAAQTEQDFAEGMPLIAANGTVEERVLASYSYVDKNSRRLFLRFRIIGEYLATMATEEGRQRYFELDDRYAQLTDILQLPNVLVSELLEASLVGLLQLKEAEHIPVDFEAHGKLMAQVVSAFGDSTAKVKRLSGRELRKRRLKKAARAQGN
jgi:AcrR family transcriptional regulator